MANELRKETEHCMLVWMFTKASSLSTRLLAIFALDLEYGFTCGHLLGELLSYAAFTHIPPTSPFTQIKLTRCFIFPKVVIYFHLNQEIVLSALINQSIYVCLSVSVSLSLSFLLPPSEELKAFFRSPASFLEYTLHALNIS